MPVEPDHRGAVLSLLDALTAMGRADEVIQIRNDLDARNWQIESQDVAVLAARLSSPPQQAPSVERDVANPSSDSASWPDFVELYRPFVEAMTDWSELLTATNRLLGATSWPTLHRAAHQVFCDVLGFDDRPVALTHRLVGRSAIEDFEQIGDFAGFKICLVRLTRSLSDTRWSNKSEHYRPCFRLVPQALLISFEPGAGAIRLVFRQRHGRADSRPWYRCIRGPWFLRDAQENLLTICRRLDRCRPGMDQDQESFGRRVQAALECDVGALAEEWVSTPIAVQDQLPGLPLTAATAPLMRAFLCLKEWCWGLRARFTNLFPYPVCLGELWLDLVRVELVGGLPPAENCWRTGRTRTQRMTLHLELRTWDRERVIGTFTLTATLIVPDEKGWFWVAGKPFRYRAEVGADGRLLSRTTMPDWVDQIGEDDESEPVTDSYTLQSAEGASVDAVIGRAIERRMWRLLRNLRRRAEGQVTASQLRARMLSTVPPGAAFQLLTPATARALLVPVDIARPMPEMGDAASPSTLFIPRPPAWACPDVSAALAPHHWSAVAGARIHPTGAVAIPTGGVGDLRLTATGASAFEVNPRLGAAVTSDKSWWVHPRLVDFAELQAGVLEQPARVAASGVIVEAEVIVSPSIHQPQISPGHRPGRTILRTFVDVPGLGGVDVAPSLLVVNGQALQPGAPWLRIPAQLLAHEHEDSDSHLGLLLGHMLGGMAEGVLTVRLPWDCNVVVRAVGLEPISQLGALTGWRAWIEVIFRSDSPVLVVLPSGKLRPIAQGWHPEELPYGVDGEVPFIGLPGDCGDVLRFSGVDGETTLIAQHNAVMIVPSSIPIRDRAAIAAVDRMPRPSVRSYGEPWNVTRLRWIAHGASPQWLSTLNGGHIHRKLLAWCAGLAALPPETDCEEVTAVPLTSRPQLVGRVLSTVTWAATCSCGRLKGRALLGASCLECDHVVGPVETLGTVRQVRLPAPVLHPWAKEIASTVLGLATEELSLLLTRHGPRPVISACASALASPTENARRRLALPSTHARSLEGQTRRWLGQMIEFLESGEGRAGLESAFALSRVGVPSLDLVKVGSTLDDIDPTGSRLMVAYARLHGACWALREAQRLNAASLLVTAEVHLQDCVDAVFGEAGSDSPDTLAGLIRIARPWSRGGYPAITVPRSAPTVQPGSQDWWQKRAARAQLIEHHAMDLLGLVASIPGLTPAKRDTTIKALAADILDEQRDQRGLVALLHTEHNRPTQLPSEWSRARQVLSDRLGRALGGESLPAVVNILGGWWMGECSDSIPSGAIWTEGGRAGPPGFRRRVPPLSHVLWRSWSGLRSVRPELGLVSLFGAEELGLSLEVREERYEEEAERAPIVRIQVSSTPQPEPSKFEATQAAVSVATASSVQPALTPTAHPPALAAAEDIRIITRTIRSWLEDE